MEMQEENWVSVARKGHQNGNTMRQALNGGGGENNRWYFVAGRKQLAVEKLRNNAIRLIEYSAKQTFSVVIDSRAIRWLLKEISQGGGQTKDNFSASYWHEGMVTISVQRIKNDRGLALKILKLTGNGRQMILIPESNGIHPWGGLVEAIEGIVRLGETQNKGKEVAEQNQMGCQRLRGRCRPPQQEIQGRVKVRLLDINHHREGTKSEPGNPTSSSRQRHRQPLKEWEPAIVVFRSSIFCPWELIEERLTKELNRSASLKPLGEDRAVLFCTSEIERDKLLTRTAVIGGDLIDKACTWKPEVHWEERRWGGANCWISLSGIPLSMWNREAFAKIAERFGGLLEINILTLQRQNLERAVVKVKGRLKGFFPTEVVIPSPEGVFAKISVAKFRVEDRCIDPIQMREFLGLIGANEQRMPVDDNGGDLDLRFENAKDCRVEDPTTKKNQVNIEILTNSGKTAQTEKITPAIPRAEATSPATTREETMTQAAILRRCKAVQSLCDRSSRGLEDSQQIKAWARLFGFFLTTWAGPLQNKKAQWNQGMGSNSKEPNTEGLDPNKVQSEPSELCDKDKKRTSVSFAVGDIHGFSDPPQEGTSVVLQEHENQLAEEQRRNIQAKETNTLNEEIIEVEVEKEGEMISDSEESNGTTEALEGEQSGSSSTSMSGKMNGL
ncbi:hypothetical protein Sjap_018345 [Stephania japonica]|uniref:DUF4283 domain-containing protein n=1 Tax=Stephania japonica TaxID=461633 RepID=A0AAP0I7W1_9MAGN